MPRIEHLRVFPLKGFDGVDLESAAVLDGGTLEYDREYALFDQDGDVINGKRTDQVHELTTDFRLDENVISVGTDDGADRTFHLGRDREEAALWFSQVFDEDLTLRRDSSLGFVDRRGMGPSLISTATLETVADWFDELDVEGARRRLRANVEVAGVPPFWEDRFVSDDAPLIQAGEVQLDGVTPCGRCIVPTRNPDTGEALPEFREQFLEKRRETFPEWADEAAFDHYYSLMIIMRVPESTRGERLRVGDRVEVVES